jgi:hypothetical protein
MFLPGKLFYLAVPDGTARLWPKTFAAKEKIFIFATNYLSA